MRRINLLSIPVIALFLLTTACGGGEPELPAVGSAPVAAPAQTGHGLTAEELEKGVGPITHVELGAIDMALVEQGRAIFERMCAACHLLDERLAGPPLRDVLGRRTPEFVMNMILNPQEMLDRHPEARKLLGEYYSPMPTLGLTPEEARLIVEYLRQMQGEGQPGN